MSEAIMSEWYKWAEMFNKFAPWVTIGLAFLWWYLAGNLFWFGWSPLPGLAYLIMGIAGGILYFIMVQKKVASKDQTRMTHIWLLVCAILGGAEIFIPLVFLFYSILSDVPIWKAFSSK